MFVDLWCQSSGRPSPALFTSWSNFLSFGRSPGSVAKGSLPFLFYVPEKENISIGESGAAWPVPKTAGCVFVVVLSIQKDPPPCLRQELFSPWYPFCIFEHYFFPSLLETLRNAKLGKAIPKQICRTVRLSPGEQGRQGGALVMAVCCAGKGQQIPAVQDAGGTLCCPFVTTPFPFWPLGTHFGFVLSCLVFGSVLTTDTSSLKQTVKAEHLRHHLHKH